MSKAERIGLLTQQGPVWGDDELLHGLTQTANGTDVDQHVHVWDPLLVSGLVEKPVTATWQSLILQLGAEATVVSAVLLGGHWVPLVWRVDMVGSKLHTLPVPVGYSRMIDDLSRVIELHRGGTMGGVKIHGTGFMPTGHCGALVIAFVRHLLWGWQMVDDQASLDYYSIELRQEFSDHAFDPCPRPLLAGLGLSVLQRLAEVLVQHGVSVLESQSRASVAMKALGEDEVARALNADNPWRELKWLGNQSRPPFQLIKPSELQAQIDKRSADRPVGNKKHKQGRTAKGKGKGFKPPAAVDPALLRLEPGIFQSDAGQPLAQIGLAQVGASVSGVVVVSVTVIDPYLKATHPLSSGPLALFVVDAKAEPVTAFPVTQERVPLVCTANSEPLLVDGFLIQLGAVPVCRTPMQQSCAVQSVPTCVVKAMVFRDQTKLPWSEVVAHPLLHVFSMVPPMMTCQEEECLGCECWHRSTAFPMDTPVLELWGKQWLQLDFSHAPPDQAELFTAHLRLPEHLQQLVQQFSGHDGVYLEPKSVDGRRPSPDFQVVWMPRSDQAQLMLQRQTVAHVIGLARLGNKMGLRCRTEHAPEVFATLKPGHTFLPPGKRQTFLVGPFAYGTLQTSVAQVLHENGWTAKPIQTVAAKSHVQGLMFRVQSVQDPPVKMLRMAHGDVMIAREADPEVPDRPEPRVVATSATESFVSKPFEGDIIQQNDPWAKAASRLPTKTATFQIGNPLEDMTHKVVAEVMAKLPQPQMEVDGDETQAMKIATLEQQVKDLHGQTQALASQAQQHAQESSSQFQEIRGQIQQQGVHFDAALASQATTMHSFQETFQEQFRQQVHQQQTMLDGMFSKQMTQFESLLAKRSRQE